MLAIGNIGERGKAISSNILGGEPERAIEALLKGLAATEAGTEER